MFTGPDPELSVLGGGGAQIGRGVKGAALVGGDGKRFSVFVFEMPLEGSPL